MEQPHPQLAEQLEQDLQQEQWVEQPPHHQFSHTSLAKYCILSGKTNPSLKRASEDC